MLGKPKYLLLIFAYFFVEGAYFQYNKRFPVIGVAAGAGSSITTSSNISFINDGIGRLGGGVLAYFLVNKINSYFFLFIFSICTFIGHFFFFLTATLQVGGTFGFLSIHFWMSLAAGAFWTLVAEIIIDDGGIRNFGMNWGMAVFFNFLGLFFFQMMTVLLNFRSKMGILYLVSGILVPLFVFIAWKLDQRDE